MFAEEWPLLVFTLFSQLAIGMFFMLVVVRSFLTAQDSALAAKVIQPGMMVTAPVMAVALLLSSLHLGSPLGAYRAIVNLGSSWLSREIIITGGFFGLLVVCLYARRKGKSVPLLEWITAIVGLASVFSTASLYGASIRPAWNGAYTYIAFFGTTLALGSIGAAGSILFSSKGDSLPVEVAGVLKTIGYTAILSILIPLLYLPVYLSGLSTGGQAALASVQLFSDYAVPVLLRWMLSFVGIGTVFYTVYKQVRLDQAISMNTVYMAAALVFAGECIGRYIFYAIAVSIGIG